MFNLAVRAKWESTEFVFRVPPHVPLVDLRQQMYAHRVPTPSLSNKVTHVSPPALTVTSNLAATPVSKPVRMEPSQTRHKRRECALLASSDANSVRIPHNAQLLTMALSWNQAQVSSKYAMLLAPLVSTPPQSAHHARTISSWSWIPTHVWKHVLLTPS